MSTHVYVAAAAKAVVKAGKAICELPRVFQVKEGEGHRSGITKGDLRSQEILLQELGQFPYARFLCEEDTSHPSAFNKKNPQGILNEDCVFIIDAIDSTARYGAELDGWCVAVGVMEYGEITGGAVFAPASQGGFLVVSEKGKGVTTMEWDGRVIRSVIARGETPPKDSIVLFGADAPLFRNIANILPEIYANVRLASSGSSGILSFARVGARRVQAVIQTPQKAWDWIPAYRAALETGNTVHFFRTVKGELVPVPTYDFESMCTSMQIKSARLGFVAGEPALAQRLFDLLPRTGWERFVPDTVSGKW